MSTTLKATGYVREVDGLGRVVLPVSVRRDLDIEPKDDLEIFVDGESIILQKYAPGCVFCGEHEDVGEFRGKLVCRACRDEIESLHRPAAD